MDKYIKEKIIYRFWNETFYKINSDKLSELLESSKNNKENIYETSNDFNNNKNNNLEFKYNSNDSSFSTNYSSITLSNTDKYSNHNNINKDFIIIDFRDKEEYNKLHIIQAINFPPINISRDKFPFDMVLMRNKPGKIIIMYYKDIKKGIKYLNDCMERYDNIVLLDGGIENFREEYPEFLEGQEKEKYIKIKKEKDEKKRNEWNFNFID